VNSYIFFTKKKVGSLRLLTALFLLKGIAVLSGFVETTNTLYYIMGADSILSKGGHPKNLLTDLFIGHIKKFYLLFYSIKDQKIIFLKIIQMFPSFKFSFFIKFRGTRFLVHCSFQQKLSHNFLAIGASYRSFLFT
jgi:hypothetical protein